MPSFRMWLNNFDISDGVDIIIGVVVLGGAVEAEQRRLSRTMGSAVM